MLKKAIFLGALLLAGLWIWLVKINADPFHYKTYNNETLRILSQENTVGNSKSTSHSKLSCDGNAYLLRYGKNGMAVFFPNYIDYSGWASGYLFDKREYRDVKNGDTITVNMDTRDGHQSFILKLMETKGKNWYYLETFS